jgi:purine-binding chemotaxis protein CheW
LSDVATSFSDGQSTVEILTVHVDDQQVAFHLSDVAEVLPAAATAHLPHAPDVIRGLLNLRGRQLPVIDLRARLGLPSRPADPDDHVVVSRVGQRGIGIWVDRAVEVRRLDLTDLAPLAAHATGRHVCGAAMLDDGVLLVSDVETFLDAQESDLLDRALAAANEVGARG